MSIKTLFLSLIIIILTTFILIVPINPNAGDKTSLATKALQTLDRFGIILQKKPKIHTILLGGDVMLGRTVMSKSLDMGDSRYPFAKISKFLQSADISMVNLENPVVENCMRHYEGLIFCAPPEMLDSLVFAGIDIVNLANNHTLNHGKDGLLQTIRFLDEKGIAYTGLGRLTIREIDGIKYGFLGFNFVDKAPTEDDYKLISDSDKKVDNLIVNVHWGVEYQGHPSTSQREWAKKIIENGADIIVGHHPHWVQDIDHIGGKPVYYSLGNLVFDQMWSEKTKMGLMVEFTFEDGKLTKEDTFDTYMESWAQPSFVSKK